MTPKFNPPTFLALTAVLLVACSNHACADQTAKRPNLIIIYVDDLARGDVGAFGCPDPGTENIDRLAASGVKLTTAYTHNAPCSPSRTALMMGMYTQRFGKYDLSRGVPIPEDKPTLAEMLRDAGYVTGVVGLEKWDIGAWNQGVLDRGFMEAGMHPPRVEGREGFGGGSSYLGADGSYLTEVEGGYCVDFIGRHGKGDKPFFLYFTPLAVHIPLTEVPEKYLRELYPDHQGEYAPRQYLRATLHCLDVQIGLIMDKLREMGIEDETMIIFSSDNGGDPSAQHRPFPYRGGKKGAQRSNLQWEGNYRMPTLVSFPGTLKAGGEYGEISSTVDFYATAAALAKAPLPGHCDGIDMLPLLSGAKQADPERALFWKTHGSRIARWKQWRIVKFRDEPEWRLYDIVADPGETTDLAKQHPDVTAALAAKYDAWLAQMAEPVAPVKPPAELLPHTAQGQHARRPFGRGWMTVDQWDKIKDDFTQWSEFHVRQRMLAEIKDTPKQ